MKKYLPFIFVALMLASCGKESNTVENSSTAEEIISTTAESEITQEKSTSALSAVEKADLLRNALDAEPDKLPYYGGCHIDENRNLLVCVVDEDPQFIAFCKELLGDVEIRPCEYSLEELRAVQNTIEEKWVKLNKEDELYKHISSVSLREDLNRISVHFRQGDQELIDMFKETILDSDAVVFEFVE